MKLVTADQMRRLDARAIGEIGIPGVVLMENAGQGAARLAERYFGPLKGKKIIVLAGRGNNGGDGFVMARLFHARDCRVRVFLLGAASRVAGDAAINLQAAGNVGVEMVELDQEAGGLDALSELETADLIVDAMLGTGIKSDVRGIFRAAIERVNAAKAPVLAVDLPSGLDADTGQELGVAVRAALTVTFGLPKLGLAVFPGCALAGVLEVVDIGIPPHLVKAAGIQAELVTRQDCVGALGPRPAESHKGAFGHALIVGGSTGKTGALCLAALAAARVGAGLVTAACPASLNPIVEAKLTEPMTEPLAEDGEGFLYLAALDRALEIAKGKSVVALGPGMGQREGVGQFVRELVKRAETPLVIDADGLNALAGGMEVLKKARREVALTPHPGEMARLTGLSTASVQADRLGVAGKLARECGVYVVLKGARTVVAAPDGGLMVNTSGSPVLAAGGSGDVLTGMIAGLLAQGLGMKKALGLGVFLHGLAGEELARTKGPAGVLASELAEALPGLLKEFMA